MSENSISDTAVLELAELFRPIQSIKTQEQLLQLLEKLGYKFGIVEDIQGLVEKISGTIAAVEKAIPILEGFFQAQSEDERKGFILELIPKISAIFSASERIPGEVKSILETTLNVSEDSLSVLSELPVRLLDFLIFIHIYKKHPRIFGALHLMGILEYRKQEKDETRFLTECYIRTVNWNRLPRYFYEPGKVINEIYDWNGGIEGEGNKEFNSDEFLKRFALFLKAMQIAGGIYKQSENVKNALINSTSNLDELRIPIFSNGVYPESYTGFGLNITPAEKRANLKKGLAFIPYLTANASLTYDYSENWKAELKAGLFSDAGLGLTIRPPFSLDMFNNIFNNETEGSGFKADAFINVLQKQNGEYKKFYLFGQNGTTHLSASEISLKYFATSDAAGIDAGAELEIKKIRLFISLLGKADSFIASILPGAEIDSAFSLIIGFSLKNGIYFKGSAGIEILLPIHIPLGPVDIQNILIAIRPENGIIPLELSTGIKAKLGPLFVSVENIGLIINLSFPEGRDGKLGSVDFNLEFKPPTKLGLSIDAGIIKGGGYLECFPERGEYNGTLELGIEGLLTLNAIGLITTQNPDGSPGFSLLIVITTEFNPAFQLGFGFTLNGVGGLLGLNRMVVIEKLREGVKTNAVDNILFPEKVVGNAPTIISNLQSIFPVRQGSFVVGPMAKIGWGSPTIISLSLGVIIQLPDVKIAILGVLKMILPDEKVPLIKMQVNFLGVIDPSQQLITFDADLFDSKLLGTMTLTGQMLFYLKWGNQPDFIFSVGGFHPAYRPGMQVKKMERLGIRILDEDNASIRFETYFALTPNTLQFGASIHAYFDVGMGTTVDGYLGFDTLFQFSPFYFEVTAEGKFNLKCPLGETKVDIYVELTGISPWSVKARGSVEAFNQEIEFDFPQFKWGEEKAQPASSVKVEDILKECLKKDDAWQADSLSNAPRLVSISNPAKETGTVLRILPSGGIKISQKLVPLNTKLEKFGASNITGKNDLSIQSVSIGGNEAKIDTKTMDFFAAAQFFTLSNAKRLSKPSFEKFENGVIADFSNSKISTGGIMAKKVVFEKIFWDGEERVSTKEEQLQGSLFWNGLKFSRSYLSPLSQFTRETMLGKKRQQKPVLPVYEIVSAFDGEPVTMPPGIVNVFSTIMHAEMQVNDMIKEMPAMNGIVSVRQKI